MLFPRLLHLFGAQRRERLDDPSAGGMRHDHIIQIAARGRHEGIGESLGIFLRAGGDLLGIPDIGPENDFHRPLGAHHRDLRRRPSVIDIAAQVF